MKKTGRLFWIPAILLGMTGCEQLFQQHADRHRARAEAAMKDKDYAEAVRQYEASLDGTPRTAEVHYQLGMLYDQHLDQPLSAVHHYQRYLELAPDGPRAREAANFIKEDHLAMMTRYGFGALMPQQEGVRLKNENQALRLQISKLREELEEANKARLALMKSMNAGSSRGGRKGTEPIKRELIPGVRTYTVEPRDTLASISRKFYKTPNRWKEIQDANFIGAEGTVKLKPGMVLMIP